MKILLADDHDLFRAGLGMVLGELGADTRLLQAASLDAAIHCAEAEPDLDLALLDLNMPTMNGTAGLQKFREQFPDVPVVIVSGSDELSDVQQAVGRGRLGFYSQIHRAAGNAFRFALSAFRGRVRAAACDAT